NAGTFKKTVTTGTTTFYSAAFESTGAVQVQKGTLRLQAGGSGTGKASQFAVSSGATLDFAGGNYTLDADSSLGGDGTQAFSGGTTSVGGGYLGGTTVITGGTVNFNSAATTLSGSMSGGTMAGTGSFGTTNSYSWTGGTISTAIFGPGIGATLTISGPASK